MAHHLGHDLQQEMNRKLQDGVGDLADSIQQMAKLIDLKIRNSKTILSNDHDIFSDIAERRSNVLQELQQTFSTFLNRSENFTDDELFPDKKALAPNLAAGSGIAVIGLILTVVTNISVLDITGGVLSAIGFLFAGVSTRVKRRKIIDGFQTEIDRGRTQLETEVADRLKTYIQNLKERIDANFLKFDALLEKEEKQIATLAERQEAIELRLREMSAELASRP